MASFNLPFTIPYDKIKKGKIYLVGFPFDDGRPLTFVEPDGDAFKLVEKDYGFDPITDQNGHTYAPEVSVVVKHKAKLAVVLQADDLNINGEWSYTFVAPIDSIGPQELAKNFIRRAMTLNDLDRIHYTKCTGKDAIIEITKIRRTHKNLIFKSTKWELPAEDISLVLMKLAKILNIEKIPACADCEMNCENCELKAVSSSSSVS